MFLKSHHAESHIHIDFVPMVDTLFNLLIFFLLATSMQQVEREINIALPAANAAGPISAAMREIIVNVDGEGKILIAGKVTDPETLKEMISQAVKQNADEKVTVRGDRNTPYANIVRVLDICKASGVQEPYLETVLNE